MYCTKLKVPREPPGGRSVDCYVDHILLLFVTHDVRRNKSHTQGGLSRMKKALIYIALFGVAFGVKSSYLHERAKWPDFQHPTLDSQYHDEWAQAIATGQWNGRIGEIPHQPFFRAPLYPYFLSVVYRLGGHDYFRLGIVQMVLGALSALLLYRLTLLLFGRRTALLAFFLYLGYWPVTYFEGELLIPVLVVFLDLLAVVLAIEAARRERPILWLLSGGVLGLSAVARPNILVAVPFILWWIWKRTSARGIHVRSVLMVAAPCLAVIMPVTIRNAAVGGDFVPIASQGGVNFYIGNNAESNGVLAVVPGTRADWWGGFDDTNEIAKRELGHAARPSEISDYWFRRGLSYLTTEPRDAARLYGRKLLLFLGNGEVSNNRQLYFVKERSLALSLLALNFAFLLGFGIAGILLRNRGIAEKDATPSLRLDRTLPLRVAVPYALSVIAFFVTSRYRLPVSVMLVPFAAHGLLWIFDRARHGEPATSARWGALVVVVFVLSLLNPFGVGAAKESRGYYALGVDYSHSDPEAALDAFTRSIDKDPSFAPAWKMRGWVLYRLNQNEEAINDLRRACAIDSSFVDAFYTLGVVYQVEGQHDRAAPLYERVIALDPDHKEALANRADIYMRDGDPESALPLLERAIGVDSTFANAIFGLGTYYEQVGRIDEAIAKYRQIGDIPAGRLGLVLLFVKRGRLDEAETALRQWRDAYPTPPDIDTLAELVARYREP